MDPEIRKAQSEAKVHPKVHKEVMQQLKTAFNETKDPKGLALLYGNTDPPGVATDVENMRHAFSTLGFAVLSKLDQGKEWIEATMVAASQYCYPDNCKFIVFYYAGHGGSEDTHTFIYPNGREKEMKLFIEEGILRKFYPENAPELGHRVRLFFFDTCLVDDTLRAHGREITDKDMDFDLPPRGNILVAYSTSMTFASRGSEKGGVWTQYLHKNITELDHLPITTVLDITWIETMLHSNRIPGVVGSRKIQGPHYISCMGLTYLHHPEYDLRDALNYCLEQSPSPAKKGKSGKKGQRFAIKNPFTKHTSRGLLESSGKDLVQEASNESTDSDQEERYLPGKACLEEQGCNVSPDSPSKPDPVPEDPRIIPLLEKCAEREDISRALMAVAREWKKIAMAFELDSKVIEELEGVKTAPGDKIEAVVTQWSLKGNTTTWRGLVTMLQSIEHAPKAIFQKLGKDKLYNKYK